MIQSGQILTIDADWVLNPTPHQVVVGVKAPHRTMEADVYDFRDNGRPDASRHAITYTPVELMAILRQAGLPGGLPVYLSTEHGQVLDVINTIAKPTPRKAPPRIVCLDAHLDAYPLVKIDLGMTLQVSPPGKNVTTLFLGTSMAEFVILHRHLVTPPHTVDDLKDIYNHLYSQFKLQAWLMLLSQQVSKHTATQPLDVDWIIPDHFEQALSSSGCPYPDAEWFDLLEVGAKNGFWRYKLTSSTRTMQIHPIQYKGGDLMIRMRPISQLRSLRSVRGIHICVSPKFTPDAIDQWVRELAALLTSDTNIEVLD